MTSVIPAVVVLSLAWLFLVEHCSAQDITVPSNDSAIFLVDIAKDICSVSQPCPPAQSCKVLEQVGYICRCPMGYVGVNCTTECRTHAADIAFLLDSSDSISDEDWVKMLRFVSSLVGQLQVDEGYHRIAVITFGDEATLEIRLDDYKTTKDIIARVKDLRHKKERTNIAGSLRLMRTAVFDNTDQHMQIGFLITDGASNVEREHTFNEARLVKESGIAMFAIGIGELIRPIELEAVASKPLSKHLFMEYNFEALQNIMNIVLEATCKLMPTYSAGGTGATGEQGVTGIRGVIGPAGHTGTLGSRGAKGEMGERGRIGQAGVPGSKGERGTTGATGATGKPGLTGVPGNTGLPGDPGDPGSPGISIPGPTGVQGRPGQQGRVGNTGPSGDIGLPGPVGKPGLTGTTGFGGVVGSLGIPGATGYTGEEGRTGSTGLPGPPGEDGPTGYIYEDSNECALNTSLCQHICINKRNGYKCQCYPGYKLLGDGFTCAEIDECLVENGGCEQQCVNTPGSFVCSCVFGYTMSKDRRTCIDVNECCSNQVPVMPCPATHVCINTRGSYACILHQRVRVPGQELKFQTTVVANDTITASMFLQRNVIIGVFIWLCVLTVLTILCVLLANSMSEPPSSQTSVLLPDPYFYDERPRPSGPPAEDHQHQDGLTKYNIEDNGHRLSDPVAAQIEINHRPESVIQNNTN